MKVRSIAFALWLAPVFGALWARVDAQSAESPSALFERAAAGDEDAERALADFGEETARAAFVDFASRPVAERVVRAHAIERTGRASAIVPALALLDDPEAGVRGTLVRFLARPELLDSEAVPRIERLIVSALRDEDLGVRRAALRALADIDHESAIAHLDAQVALLSGSERAFAAGLVAAAPRGRALAEKRLASAARGDETPAVFAALLPPCARAAADDPRGFESAAQRAPLVTATRHADPAVREAGKAAFDAHLSRLLAQQDHGRALRVLEGFAADGFDPCRSLEERARVALLSGTRDDEALALARELDAAARSKESPYASGWRGRAAHLEALAWIAKGDPQRAQEPLVRARRYLDERLERRADSEGKFGASEHVRVLFERAGVSVTEAGRVLCEALAANGWREPTAVPRAALEALRTAHRHALEAQAVAWHADVDAPAGFDVVFRSNVGLHELVIDVGRRPEFGSDRSLALRRTLGRAFASVAPLEALGFEPFPIDNRSLADPNDDARRRGLLVFALDALCDQLALRVTKARRALMRASIEAPGGAEPEDQRAVLEAEVNFQDAIEQRRRVEDGDFQDLAALRTPSSFVVWLARALRDEGQAAEARPYLLRARAQLDDSAVAQRFFWGIEMTAELEMMLGGAISDEGDGRAAEVELVKAERRLFELETSLKERGASNVTLALVRNQRCNALVSLAVNANVKMHDTKKAVAWFEQAWAIRQDDFMRVLLACYRAREGKQLEARALVRDVRPGPGTYYNLACTWALLGEAETALAFLKRELEVNYPSPRALEKQKEWARGDPDLESLHADPRFIALCGSAK